MERVRRSRAELARLGEERFDRAGVVLVGTIRKDGSPRISPVEPLIDQGRLLLGMMPRSKKALDLLRDPRCLVHSAIANRHGTEGEFKLRGRALDIEDPDIRKHYSEALYKKIDVRPEEPFHLFSIDIESVAFIIYENDKQSVKTWP